MFRRSILFALVLGIVFLFGHSLTAYAGIDLGGMLSTRSEIQLKGQKAVEPAFLQVASLSDDVVAAPRSRQSGIRKGWAYSSAYGNLDWVLPAALRI